MLTVELLEISPFGPQWLSVDERVPTREVSRCGGVQLPIWNTNHKYSKYRRSGWCLVWGWEWGWGWVGDGNGAVAGDMAEAGHGAGAG